MPELRTVKAYVMVSPAAPVPTSVPVLVTEKAGALVAVGVITAPDAAVAVVPPPVPVAVAVFVTDPAFTSACVTVYGAVATTVCPGASVPAAPGHWYCSVPSPASGSAMPTPVSVTFPVLLARKVYVMTLPTPPPPSEAVLVIATPGAAAMVATVTSPEDAVIAAPVGGVPLALAVFLAEPASTSD